MKKMRFAIILAIISVLTAVCSASDFDGYIISFASDEYRELAIEYAETLAFLSGDEAGTIDEVDEALNIAVTNSEELAKELESIGVIEYYEPNYIVELLDYDYTEDLYYDKQWSHVACNTPSAWQYGVYGNDVKVAVIDSGVLTTHEDLSENILPGYSYVNDDTANVTDILGHGTGVCGVIASSANGNGVVGVAHRAKLIPIQVTNTKSFTSGNLASAIYRAVQMDADVINMSLGFFTNDNAAPPATLTRAVSSALDAGVIIVAAAGNNGTTAYMYPASIDGVISVANLEVKSDGSYGKASSSQYNDTVDIIAPGTAISTTHISNNKSYVNYSGTSFSSPYVAGMAALAKSIDKSITPAEFDLLLKETANKAILNGKERTDECGYGIADTGAFVKKLIEQKSRGGFISSPDRTNDGKITVKVTSTAKTDAEYTLTASEFFGGRLSAFGSHKVTLAPGETVEITLSENDNGKEIRCHLFDMVRFAPVSMSVKSDAVTN